MKTIVPLTSTEVHDAGLRAELSEAFQRVLASGRYVLGPEVEAFEAACARRLGAAHAIGVSSGTDALLVALMALGIGPGDDVLCPTFTFFATAGAIARTGATPVFVDCARDDYGVDAASLAERITPRTRAVIPVHLFGRALEMGPILELAERRGVEVIEDAAQAFGAEDDGRCAGTIGELGCFSFYPTKNLGGFGDGGLVVTRSEAHARRIKLLRAQGASPKYHHAIVGGNFRLDALQAALLRPKLARLDVAIAERRARAERYEVLFHAKGLASADADDAPLGLPRVEARRHTFNQYTVRVRGGRRDAVRRHLAERGIETEIYYPTPLHLQPCFLRLGGRAGALPFAEVASREALSLPMFPELEPSAQELVVDAIAEVLFR